MLPMRAELVKWVDKTCESEFVSQGGAGAHPVLCNEPLLLWLHKLLDPINVGTRPMTVCFFCGIMSRRWNSAMCDCVHLHHTLTIVHHDASHGGRFSSWTFVSRWAEPTKDPRVPPEGLCLIWLVQRCSKVKWPVWTHYVLMNCCETLCSIWPTMCTLSSLF